VNCLKGVFEKLFKLEQNPLNETQSEIQLAKMMEEGQAQHPMKDKSQI